MDFDYGGEFYLLSSSTHNPGATSPRSSCRYILHMAAPCAWLGLGMLSQPEN